MNDGELLEMIWSGALELRGRDTMSPLARLLDALLVVPTVTLVSKAGSHRPVALAEGSELLPGAPLGDILAEELGIHVPHDAVVLVEPVEMADTSEVSAAELGRELGAILMSMAAAPQEAGLQAFANGAARQYSSQVAGHGLATPSRARVANI